MLVPAWCVLLTHFQDEIFFFQENLWEYFFLSSANFSPQRFEKSPSGDHVSPFPIETISYLVSQKLLSDWNSQPFPTSNLKPGGENTSRVWTPGIARQIDVTVMESHLQEHLLNQQVSALIKPSLFKLCYLFVVGFCIQGETFVIVLFGLAGVWPVCLASVFTRNKTVQLHFFTWVRILIKSPSFTWLLFWGKL